MNNLLSGSEKINGEWIYYSKARLLKSSALKAGYKLLLHWKWKGKNLK